ncbi:MAG: M20/M25/M40 family metallo-hydrolase [Thermoanaerobaculaceae bacterium]|jgi:carboxypeptidase PM20D1|nr:M20/M25/M40 family metallo-hydrolase [Thermoanaerobaculaceae bacterium]
MIARIPALCSLLLTAALTFGAGPSGPPLESAVQRFSKSLTFRTVSHADPAATDRLELARFHAFLREAFPLVHSRLECRLIGQSALLYHWPGTRPSLKPLILLAHQDVVAVDEATLHQWTHPPFSGVIADGFVWGRGARDFKPGLMAILESAEWLLQQGFVPERSLYLAFGDDEEVQGYGGAGAVAGHLAAAGVQAELILDEGGGVALGMVGGVDPRRPVAMIAVAEKGYLSLDLVVEGSGGHSAASPRENPIVVLADALRRIEAKPFPAALQEPVPSMLAGLGEGMGFWKGFVFSNLWLTGGVTTRVLLGDPETEAMIRTTVAITRFSSGVQDNVIPGRASAVANLRLLPGCSIPQAMQHLTDAIDDPRVKLSVRGRASEAPPVTPVSTPGYALISSAIRTTFPGALVAPSITAGTTDIRHYARVSHNLYRFVPSVSTHTFSGNGHRTDERLPVENYRQYLTFYSTFMREGAGPRSGLPTD